MGHYVAPAEYSRALAITPSDTTDQFPTTGDAGFPYARRLMIGTGGTIKVTTIAGDTVTFTVPAGAFDCAVKRVFATGTTATNITAQY